MYEAPAGGGAELQGQWYTCACCKQEIEPSCFELHFKNCVAAWAGLFATPGGGKVEVKHDTATCRCTFCATERVMGRGKPS